VSGYITGVRFYKGPLNTGTHVGPLVGYQTAILLGTVDVQRRELKWVAAGNLLLADCHQCKYHLCDQLLFAPHGQYAENDSYFHDQRALIAPPLHGLASGVDGVNGVYTYTSTGGISDQTAFRTQNYWVDVVFFADQRMSSLRADDLERVGWLAHLVQFQSITWTTKRNIRHTGRISARRPLTGRALP